MGEAGRGGWEMVEKEEEVVVVGAALGAGVVVTAAAAVSAAAGAVVVVDCCGDGSGFDDDVILVIRVMSSESNGYCALKVLGYRRRLALADRKSEIERGTCRGGWCVGVS